MKTFRFVFLLFPAVSFLIFLSGVANARQAVLQDAPESAAQVEVSELGGTRNVHRVGKLFLAGQFGPNDVEIIKTAGVEMVISLRSPGEIFWDEKLTVEQSGLKFESFGFVGADALTDEIFAQVRQRLKNNQGKTLLHCGGADRVGAVWLAHRVLDEKIPLEQALGEAHEIGLKTPEYEQRAIEYIQSQQSVKTAPTGPATPIQESSVKPGINDGFLSPELDPAEWIKRFEIESREIYAARMEVLKACAIGPGSRIADIGAGTGIYTRLFANQTGPTGWVYAIDISPRLIQHINQQSKSNNQPNVTAILCQENSVNLPPESIELAFICDTYHHFEYPVSTLAAIHSALKPGGRVVVIDFKRVEGESRPWTIEHVRAGQEVFTAEIEGAGFELLGETKIPGFDENYFLMFKKR